MRLVLLALLVGCSFRHGSLTVVDGDIDPDVVEEGDAADACTSWSPRHFDACGIPMPGTDVNLTGAQSPLTYNTTMAGGALVDASNTEIPITSVEYMQTGGVAAALWVVEDLQLDTGVELRVVGTKPLIIAAWGSITVDGTIDAGSYRNVRVGAGSNPAECAAHAAGSGANGSSGNGGGGGGGFQGNGAAGGRGDSNCTPAPPTCEKAGGLGGMAVLAPTIVIGGCNGGASGLSGTQAAPGGRGGGAVLLAARTAIRISGTLLAGGMGGAGDTSASVSLGGGGGGSGGFLGLDAPSIDVTGATIAANGGAGGAGADIANTGTRGGDAVGIAFALGGMSGGGGTNGGAGSSMTVLDGGPVPGATPVGGGGGGGGGAGFVLYWGTTLTGLATISPPALAGP